MGTAINLHDEAYIIHWVRLAAETLSDRKTHFICNDIGKRGLPYEKQQMLMLELISKEPRPFVAYLESGLTHLRRRCHRRRHKEIAIQGKEKRIIFF